jgi:hypothetical protein
LACITAFSVGIMRLSSLSQLIFAFLGTDINYDEGIILLIINNTEDGK